MAGIYIHIPFCKQKCHYCDFYKETTVYQKSGFLKALSIEMKERNSFLMGEKIDTIYFGGGTPSVLSILDIRSILSEIDSLWDVAANAEITMEANPDDLSPDYLNDLIQTPVNRLSIGIQALDDEILRFLYRRHRAQQAVEVVEMAKAIGFKSISIDFIYGIPGLSLSGWKDCLSQAIQLDVDHISAYHLGIEPDTQFGRLKSQGKIKEIDEEVSLEHYQIMCEMLGRAGYQHYEISNFCRPGRESRHNSSYWNNQIYLGLGPSAHSYNGTERSWNVRNLTEYIRQLNKPVLPSESEVLSDKDRFNEMLMTKLRTQQGLSLNYLKQTFPETFINELRTKLQTMIDNHLLVLENEMIRIPEKQWFVSDSLIADLFIL